MLLWSMMLLDVFSEIGDPKCKSHPYVAIEEDDEQNQQASNDNHGHVVREIEPILLPAPLPRMLIPQTRCSRVEHGVY